MTDSTVRVTNTTAGPYVLSGHCAVPAGETVEVPYTVAMRFQKARGLQWDFSAGELPFKTDGKLSHLTFMSNLMPTGGYGIVGLQAMRGLIERGVDVSVSADLPSWLRSEITQHYPDLVPRIWRPDPFVSRVGLSHTVPSEFHLHPSPTVVGWTMWERTRLPRPWVDLCKRCARIIVPAKGQIPIFEETGVPISVVPDAPGVEHFPFKSDRDPSPETFTWITWGRLSSRKCPVETLQVFSAAFPAAQFPNVRMVFKTQNQHFGGGVVGIPEIRDPRVTVVDEDWPRARLVEMCHSAQAAIFLSRGEGCGNPSLQAMATGLPVVLSDHSGLSDQCRTDFNYPVPLDPRSPFVPAPPLRGEDPKDPSIALEWWQSDFDAAVEQMRNVYQNYGAALKKARKASTWVKKNFSTERMVDGLIAVLATT